MVRKKGTVGKGTDSRRTGRSLLMKKFEWGEQSGQTALEKPRERYTWKLSGCY